VIPHAITINGSLRGSVWLSGIRKGPGINRASDVVLWWWLLTVAAAVRLDADPHPGNLNHHRIIHSECGLNVPAEFPIRSGQTGAAAVAFMPAMPDRIDGPALRLGEGNLAHLTNSPDSERCATVHKIRWGEAVNC